MTGQFSIEPDRVRGFLNVEMSGFYTLDDVGRYHAAIEAASEALPQPPERQVMLCDISRMQIQAQDVVAAFRDVMSDPRYRRRRVAFVVASTLARMQLLRVIGERTVHIFTSADEASDWLFAREPGRTAA